MNSTIKTLTVFLTLIGLVLAIFLIHAQSLEPTTEKHQHGHHHHHEAHSHL